MHVKSLLSMHFLKNCFLSKFALISCALCLSTQLYWKWRPASDLFNKRWTRWSDCKQSLSFLKILKRVLSKIANIAENRPKRTFFEKIKQRLATLKKCKQTLSLATSKKIKTNPRNREKWRLKPQKYKMYNISAASFPRTMRAKSRATVQVRFRKPFVFLILILITLLFSVM